MSRASAIGAAVVATLLVVGGVVAISSRAPSGEAWRGEVASCPPGVDAAHLDEALDLGRRYLLTHLGPSGGFTYEYDWSKGTDSDDDSEVRQAGAAWGVALLHHDRPDPELAKAMLRAIAFWNGRSRTDALGRRWTAYPGSIRGQTGATALVALAHVEALRSADALEPVLVQRLREHLDGYLRFIRSMRMSSGGFADSYRIQDGMPGVRRSNPYADGECLLVLVKAAKYLDISGGWDELEAFVETDYGRWVTVPRSEDPDPDRTKGHYQWGSMTWWELADAGRSSELWGERLVELAEWMIVEHRTLRRRKNTAYAYEGMVLAWEWAQRENDPRANRIECVIEQGLPKLATWQIGHSTALPALAEAARDPRAVGGVQNAADEAPLRIDVVQHQMHATMLARRYGVPAARP